MSAFPYPFTVAELMARAKKLRSDHDEESLERLRETFPPGVKRARLPRAKPKVVHHTERAVSESLIELHRSLGRCVYCGDRVGTDGYRCDPCLEKHS